MKVYRNQSPKGNTDFYEYSFQGGLRLNVPGDWNSQTPELKYYEGTVWYARHFDAKRLTHKRQFLYFGAVNYRCRVYLNGAEIGSHEGGFTCDLCGGILGVSLVMYYWSLPHKLIWKTISSNWIRNLPTG